LVKFKFEESKTKMSTAAESIAKLKQRAETHQRREQVLSELRDVRESLERQRVALAELQQTHGIPFAEAAKLDASLLGRSGANVTKELEAISAWLALHKSTTQELDSVMKWADQLPATANQIPAELSPSDVTMKRATIERQVSKLKHDSETITGQLGKLA
jgi:hypothetical protein